ncbi:MAG TPA: DUF2007 domain-containing protein [Candidatus Binatia bacterium]|nr:DUF2007 domain-containing protein [Candidatus Binatia bacterium]
MEPVTVLTFNDAEQAEPLKQRLEQAGIPAVIYDERKLQRVFLCRDSLAGIRVRVDRKDFEHARVLLREWDKQDRVLRDAIHCPECGASRVQYPQFTRKFVLPNFGALLCAVGLIEWKFYCQECQFTWPRKKTVPPDLDLLGWPKKAPVHRH